MQVWETTARDAGTKNHSERRAFLNILDNTCVKDVESGFDPQRRIKILTTVTASYLSMRCVGFQ